MPIFRTIKGNLLDLFDEGVFDTIIQGCNCMGNMGAGIALQIANRYPVVAERDKEYSRKHRTIFGTFDEVMIDERRSIINAYTQIYPGGKPLPNENRLHAIKEAFYQINKQCGGNRRFGIPMIGAGLARGIWADIHNAINEVTPNMDISLVLYKP